MPNYDLSEFDDLVRPTKAEADRDEAEMQEYDDTHGSGHCEDYPCCGHTPEDPCTRQWYDEPGAFDTTRPGNEHALCDHEVGDCNMYYEGDD